MIRGVLGSRASVGGVLGQGRGGAAAQWWLSGGVSASNAIAVYQPIGAVSLAASYTNLANPGTYTAAPGVAPTFDTASGWTFNGSTQYLTTGVVPTQGWSLIARFSNVGAYADLFIAGSGGDTPNRFMVALTGASSNYRVYGAGGFAVTSTNTTSGVMCVAGQSRYYNGASDGTDITGTPWAGVYGVTIGANNKGSINYRLNGIIQAVAIYSTTLSAAQVAAISAAMAAL